MTDWECEYYHVDERQISSRMTGQDFGAAELVRCPWCAHAHSQVTRDIAHNTIEGATVLMCGGKYAECEIGYNGVPLPAVPLPDLPS